MKSPESWGELQSLTCRKPNRVWATAELILRAPNPLGDQKEYRHLQTGQPGRTSVFSLRTTNCSTERRESLYSGMRISKAARQTGGVCRQQTGELEHSQQSREGSDTRAGHAAAPTGTARSQRGAAPPGRPPKDFPHGRALTKAPLAQGRIKRKTRACPQPLGNLSAVPTALCPCPRDTGTRAGTGTAARRPRRSSGGTARKLRGGRTGRSEGLRSGPAPALPLPQAPGRNQRGSRLRRVGAGPAGGPAVCRAEPQPLRGKRVRLRSRSSTHLGPARPLLPRSAPSPAPLAPPPPPPFVRGARPPRPIGLRPPPPPIGQRRRHVRVA